LWAERTQVKVIEEEAFEDTQLEKLEIPGSLQYIGARMCPATTELLLTTKSRNGMFTKRKRLFMVNRNHVMGRRTGHELEDGEEGECASRKRCAVL
jgi:hypothetical protein